MSLIPFQVVRLLLLLLAAATLIFTILYFALAKKRGKRIAWIGSAVVIVLFLLGSILGKSWTGHLSTPQMFHGQGPFKFGPEIPISDLFKFLWNLSNFERVEEIAADPSDLPPPIQRTQPKHLTFDLEAKEVLAEIAEGITYNYWTFNSQVPGPMLRARVGDTITLNLKNSMSSLHIHSIDFHAVTGPGGGSNLTQVPPGHFKTFTWKALNPGLFIYHCASPNSVAEHMTHGQYGLILIEPEGGLPAVDKEFYIVQGEIYTTGRMGDKGLQLFNVQGMLDECPTYIVFNGRPKSTLGKMQAKVGDKVRFFVGNAGVAKVSSFHLIGEIFDTVYPEAAIGSPQSHNVQSTVVPAGGATIVEFTLQVPGDYILVDHSLARVERGAWGILHVEGEPHPEVYRQGE